MNAIGKRRFITRIWVYRVVNGESVLLSQHAVRPSQALKIYHKLSRETDAAKRASYLRVAYPERYGLRPYNVPLLDAEVGTAL